MLSGRSRLGLRGAVLGVRAVVAELRGAVLEVRAAVGLTPEPLWDMRPHIMCSARLRGA